MSTEEILAYLKTWAALNAREVYGSPREYVHIDDLRAEIRKLGDAL